MARREKTIGSAQGKRRYDLPLNKGEGAGFLPLLIALMAFIATMTLASSFTLSALADRWKSGLEDSLTIEIPAQDATGRILKREEILELSERIVQNLQPHPAIKSIRSLSNEEIMALVEPWLGSGMSLEDSPLPGLIAVELKSNNEQPELRSLQERIAAIAPQARIDTHESWLKDVLRFTGALQFAAFLLTLIIGATTITAIAGAIRARMAVHNEDVSILHLMGASDNYIARQFQHHSMMLALKGGAAGTAAGLFTLWLTGKIAGGMGFDLLPDFHMGMVHFAILAALPLLAAGIATLTARITVHRQLEEMP